MLVPPDGRYDIREFYGAGGMPIDLTRGLRGTVAWAQLNYGGTVILPGGQWNTEPVVMGRGEPLNTVLTCAPVWIEGQGEGRTILRGFPASGEALLSWAGGDFNVISPMTYGGVRHLMLYSIAENGTAGDGIVMENTLHSTVEHVWVRGFNRGFVSRNCQDQVYRDVNGQCNQTSWYIEGANQVRLESCYANQDYHIGLHLRGGTVAWAGGLLQGGQEYGILLDPPAGTGGAIRLACRDLYVERSGPSMGPSIMGRPPGNVPGAGFAGSVRFVDANFNVASAQVMAKFDGYQVILENWAQGSSATWCEFRNCQVYGRAMPPLAGRYRADPVSLGQQWWDGPSTLEAL